MIYSAALSLAVAFGGAVSPAVSPEEAIEHLSKLREAARSGKFENLRPLFAEPAYTVYLEQMLGGAGPLRAIAISGYPAPPGLEKFGEYWVVFHRWQRLEHHHDAVFPIIRTGEGVTLGSELPEDLFIPYRFERLEFDVRFYPTDGRADIRVKADVKRTGEGPETVFMRMNDTYVVREARFNGEEIPIHSDEPIGSFSLDAEQPVLVQSGGILYLTNAGDGGELALRYVVAIDIPGGDQVTEEYALLTSYWYPHIGRAPAKSRTRVEGPKDWTLIGPGNQVKQTELGERKAVEYENDVPVSWFHIVGGPYKLVHEVEDRGRKFRAWQLGTVDDGRGKHDAEMARDSVAFFEDRFGKFPYDHYDVVDTPDFYGVECYSFTVLTPRITEWATSHEIGHTYFGGMATNTYIHSMWNEGVTQYVDSIQFKESRGRTLETGYRQRTVKVPLATISIPHGPNGNVGYMRGAYTMKMLENELGLDLMNRCLREFVKRQSGKATEWSDLETVFSDVAGRPLGWFFDQWVRSAIFPGVRYAGTWVEPGPRTGFNTSVRFLQTGTVMPYRLRFEVVLTTPSGEKRFPILLTETMQQYNFATDERPVRIEVDPMGWTLADVPEAMDLPPPAASRQSSVVSRYVHYLARP